MQKIRIDFDNPGLPQHISAVENDSQSRFFQATLYENGKAYTAPAGASYSIMYRGFGPQNQGWYDTINDGAGNRAACAVSGNVVTCEIARQALQVPGHVSIVLCVTTGKGYMLKSWPIECDCKNDRYDSTAEIQSFFYITQVSNADWTQAIQAVEELKNTIDPTLSLSGKAADAAKVGEAVGELKEDIVDLQNAVEYIPITKGYINTSQDTVDTEKIYPSDTWEHAIVPCKSGDSFRITATGGLYPLAFCFIDSNYNRLSYSSDSATLENHDLIAPINSAYLIVNGKQNLELVKKQKADITFTHSNSFLWQKVVFSTEGWTSSDTALNILCLDSYAKKVYADADYGIRVMLFEDSRTPKNYKGNIVDQNNVNRSIVNGKLTYLNYCDLDSVRKAYPDYQISLIVKRNDGSPITFGESCHIHFEYDCTSYKKTKNVFSDKMAFQMYRAGAGGGGNYSEDSSIKNRFGIKGKLSCVVGDRYRVSLKKNITCLFYQDGNWVYMNDMPMFEFVAKDSKIAFVIYGKNGNVIEDDTAAKNSIEIYHTKRKNATANYDVVVCASDSSEEDKLIADYICDGINDEKEISCAINSNIFTSTNCNVLICDGTYNIEDFYPIRDFSSAYFNGTFNDVHYSAITIRCSFVKSNGMYEVALHGKHKPHNRSINDVPSTAKLVVSESVFNALNNDKTYAVFSSLRLPDKDHMGFESSRYQYFDVKNIDITVPSAKKSIIGIDMCTADGVCVENCRITTDESNVTIDDGGTFYVGDSDNFAKECIGIRGDKGNDNGLGKSYIKHTIIRGFTEGIALTGEHFILSNSLMKSCKIGLTVGNYNVNGHLQHPNVFIGFSIEKCYQLMLLNRFGATEEREYDRTKDNVKQTIVMIGTSTEVGYKDTENKYHYTLPIKEIIKGSYVGRIESDWGNYDSIFEDGSGSGISTTLYMK